MMYAYLIKARPKAGKPNLFTWFDCKSDSRADREIMNILEDNDIETGRGADYMLPVRTNVPVFDDLPEECQLDAAWCDRYELSEDGKTWQKVAAVVDEAPEAPVVTGAVVPENPVTEETSMESTATAESTPVDKDLVVDANDNDLTEYPVAEMAFGRRLLSQLISTVTAHHIKHAQRVQIIEMSLDTDNSYVQNLLLAARHAPGIEDLSTAQLWKYTYDIKTVFPMEKRHELARVIQFTNLWLTTEHIDRGILVREWAAGNCITSVQRNATEAGTPISIVDAVRQGAANGKIKTDAGTDAGGETTTDRQNLIPHSLDILDIEIAAALLPMDFNIYEFPGGVLRRAKEIISEKEEPWKSWSSVLRKTPGILDFSRAAIFVVIRNAPENIHEDKPTLMGYIAKNLAEVTYIPDTGISDSDARWKAIQELILPPVATPSTALSTSIQPEVKRISATVFSIEGLMGEQKIDNPVINNPSNDVVKEEKQPAETVINEPVEATDSNEISGGVAVSASEGTDANDPQAAAVEEPELTEADEESSAQQILNLTQRIERLESALAALGSVFTTAEVA